MPSKTGEYSTESNEGEKHPRKKSVGCLPDTIFKRPETVMNENVHVRNAVRKPSVERKWRRIGIDIRLQNERKMVRVQTIQRRKRRSGMW